MTFAAALTKLHRLLFGTLRRQVTLGVALVVALTMLLLMWDLTLRQRALFMDRQAAVTVGVAGSLADTAAAWPTDADAAGLQQLVDAQRQLPQLEFAMLLDTQGRVLAHTDRARIGQLLRDIPAVAETTTLARSAALVEVAAPMFRSGRHIGWARVGIARRVANAALTEIMRSAAAYALAAVLASTLIAAALAARLTRRLAVIQRVAAAVEGGDLAQRAALGGTDEAAQLAHAFDRMLESLASSEARLQAILDAEPECVKIIGPDGMLQQMNAAGLVMVEAPPDPTPLIGCSVEGLIAPEHQSAFAALTHRVLAGQSGSLEFEMIGLKGTHRWMETRAVPLRDGQTGNVSMLAVTRDVSERKQAQAALIESRRLLSGLIEHSGALVFVKDRHGVYELVNRKWEEVTGIGRDAVIGRTDIELFPPRVAEEFQRNDRHVLQAGTSNEVEEVLDDATGRRYFLSVKFPVLDASGEIRSVCGMATEITERKRLQAELTQHRDHLQELVAERTAELTAARTEAERLGRAKSEFLAHMSHEIRTPLNAVLGLAQVGVLASAGTASRATFERIGDAGSHLLGVINDILDFSRLDAGKVVVEQRPFELSVALANAAGFVADAVQRKGLGFELTMAPDLPEWVSGDARRLQQILINLLSNAVKFTVHGAVSLHVAREGEQIALAVVDSGIGMTAEQLARLFQPFEQADNSSTRQFGGSGLGLAISRSLARLMGGSITVQSTAGQGSRFTLRLPLPAADPARPAFDTRPSALDALLPRRLAGLRLLAAEDLDVNRLILGAMLEHEGAEVVFAENGQAALDCVQQSGAGAFDVVLMDVQMPLMDGYEATRCLQTMAPALPVIGLTAHAMDEERDKCLAAGMVAHVTKPIDMETLVAAILRQVGGQGRLR